MHAGARVAVVVPAFCEEHKIARVISAIPSWVDQVVVVDDASTDGTYAHARASSRPGLEVLRHPSNQGVGAAIFTGYERALSQGAEVIAVMAGDGQMDPEDLARVVEPVARGQADYVKGNRFLHPDLWSHMPRHRIIGNIVLSLVTKLTSGYSQLFDSQCGYTAISAAMARALELDSIFPRYGYPNDMLAHLHNRGARVKEVSVRPIYGTEWRSGVRWHTAVYPIGFVLVQSWMKRVYRARATPWFCSEPSLSPSSAAADARRSAREEIAEPSATAERANSASPNPSRSSQDAASRRAAL